MQAVRGDLADVELASEVFAPHYARALQCSVIADATVYLKPDHSSPVLGHLTVGDVVELFDINGGWGWVKTSKVVGYLRADCVETA